MNRTAAKVLVACFVVVVLAGCRTAIYNVMDSPVVTASGKEPTMEQVKKAIIDAGVGLKWTMAEAKPGLIMGTLNVRSHQAVVDIKYNTKTYSITYKNSIDLDYDADNKTVHRHYKDWIQELDNAIKAALSAAGA